MPGVNARIFDTQASIGQKNANEVGRDTRGISASFGRPDRAAEDFPRTDGQGKQAGMLGQRGIEARAVIDDDVVVREPGLRIVPAVRGTEHPYLVPVPLELHIGFMYQTFRWHARNPHCS
jgi:hypothetical protein